MTDKDNFAISISFSAQVRHAGMIADLMDRLGVGKSEVCQTALEHYYNEIEQAEENATNDRNIEPSGQAG